jgi:flagellar protein FliS
MNYALNKYKKISINTATKEEILLMLYESAIKNCKKAIESIKKNEILQKSQYIGKLQDIIIELNNSLDHKIGKEIVDPKGLEDSLKVLNTLYEGWKRSVEMLKKNPKRK